MKNVNENTSFEELLSETMKEIKVGEIVTGTVIEVTPKGEVFIDIGYKADGIIPANEYILNADETAKSKFKIGDKISAIVVKLNDGIGNVLLSYNRARKDSDLKEFKNKVDNDDVFKATINEVNDKGLIVNFGTVKIFIPLSLAGIPRSEDPHTYKGKEVEFKVIEYNPETNRIIGSRKVLLDKEKEAKSNEFWSNIEVGKVYTGTVTSLSEYGAFVDLQGVIQGLLHISEMTWERNQRPADILKVGQEIQVTVKDLDKENKRIKLSYNEKGPNPWDIVAEKYNVGDVIEVQISNLVPFGAFAKIEKGVEGLIHISQISQKRIMKPDDVLKIGQVVSARIVTIDKENKKIELSIKEFETPQDDVEQTETAIVEQGEKAIDVQGDKALVNTTSEKTQELPKEDVENTEETTEE